MKILIRIPNWIGDAVMSLPFIETIKKNFENSEISLIGRKPAIEIFENYPGLKSLISIEGKSVFKEVKAYIKLRKEKFDKAYILPNSFQSALSMSFTRAKSIIGYLNEGRGVFLTKRIKPAPKTKIHFSNYYLELLRSDGLKEYKIENISLHLSKKEREWSQKFLKDKGREINIGISPGAAYGDSKKWFAKRFKEVGKYFEKNFNAKVFLFGSRGDVNDCKNVETGAFENLCGKTTIREAMALIKEMKLFFSNDSGLMHLANALGVPVVGIFGPTIPSHTYPYNKNYKIVFHKVECSPCKYRNCPLEKKICMEAVSVEEVIEKGKLLLNTT